MFNEKSSAWIQIYKVIAIILFFGLVALGVIGGMGDATTEFLDLGLGGDDDGGMDFLAWVLICGGSGFILLTANMLVIQLLNNVQLIREHLETIEGKLHE